MVFKNIIILVLISSVYANISGFPDINDINSIKKYIDNFIYQVDFKYQLTNKSLVNSNLNEAEEIKFFLKNLSEIITGIKYMSLFMFDYVLPWNEYHDLLIKYIHTRRSDELISLNYLNMKVYIFYSSVIHFYHQLPSIYLKNNNTGVVNLDNYCNYVTVLMDNKLLFGPEEFYEDSAKDLRAYLEEIWKYWENELDHNFCGSTPSLRHGLYNYFEFIMKTNLRRFIVSYLGIALCKRDTISASNFNETNQITSRFLNESVNYIKLIGKSLHKLTHYLYACPQKAAEKKNNHLNIELEGMIRVRLIEERSLSSSNRPCRHNCDLRSIGNKFNNTQCTKAIDCRYVSSGFDVCQKENSSRRYEWIKDYDGNIYGKSMSIKKNNICQGKITTLNSQYLWYNGYYCDYCVCTCVEKPKRSNHVVTAISFRDQTSDIYNDWVVTGIRFVRKDSLIHLQIQEGLLLPYGKIRTTRWRPLDRFGYNEKNDRYYRVSERDSELGKLVVYLPLRLGRDYGRAETVNLDDVMAPGSHVVTGVRFRFTWDSIRTPKRKRGPIELHIRVTKIDFAGGRLLNHNNSWWITPDYYDSRGELTLKNPDDPRNAPEKGGTVSTATSMRFRASDWMKDAGQSTVPFFDGRETSFTPAAPLQGLGLCHLGHEGFGGYLAFRIFDFDMSSFFFSQFDDPNL